MREEIMEKLNNLRNDKNKEVRNAADSVHSYMKKHAEEWQKNDSIFAEDETARKKRESELVFKEQYVSVGGEKFGRKKR